MDNLESKNTGELEDILVTLLIGECNPRLHSNWDWGGEGYQKELKEKVSKFVDYSFAQKRITEELREKCMEYYNDNFPNGDRSQSWLEYYKGCLIKEIRDAKLKKLI